jgi:3-methyl-2-oxobutanoate hydroxymethyltransferase
MLVDMDKIAKVRAYKGREPLPVLTATDFPMAKLLDEAGIPVLLVGDSLGMVTLGYPNTTLVTLADMQHHIRAVARAKPSGLIIGDLPYKTYESSESAVATARALVEAGAEAVKAEGGRIILDQVKAITRAGIPFCGHLGMLPQSVLIEGGYKIKGRDEAQRQALLEDADALVNAGAFAIVLELVSPPVAKEISERIPVPTIGIGSGPDCDGQVLVTADLVGMFPWFTPKFIKPRLNAAEQMRAAILDWKNNLPKRHE